MGFGRFVSRVVGGRRSGGSQTPTSMAGVGGANKIRTLPAPASNKKVMAGVGGANKVRIRR